MAYIQQTWVDNDRTYPVSAARMNHIEDGIAAANVGALTQSQALKEWASAESYQPSGTISRDASEVVTSCAVVWPDGSTGTFTTTSNSVDGAVDSYTITHTTSGLTVTQAAVTRDAAGVVTTKPALTVA